MAEIITELAESTHIYACDLRGHGRPDSADSGYRVSDYVEDISAFVGAASKAGTVLIGYSLGGLIAFGVAARLPDLVAGVIAIDPPLVLRDSNFEATAYSDAHDRIRWAPRYVTSCADQCRSPRKPSSPPPSLTTARTPRRARLNPDRQRFHASLEPHHSDETTSWHLVHKPNPQVGRRFRSQPVARHERYEQLARPSISFI